LIPFPPVINIEKFENIVNGKIMSEFAHDNWKWFQEGRVGIPITSLTLSHLCACPKLGPRFPASYVMVFFCVQWVEVRIDYLFCWYWWTCWPLFKTFFYWFKISIF
jgi:hypothetical protein